MIFAASIASQAAAALAQSMQNRKPNGSGSDGGSGQQGGFSADIDALMSNAQSALGGLVSGAGALAGNIQSIGQDMLGIGAAQAPGAASAAQAYAATHGLAD